MAYTQVSIANLALGRIGARGQIVDINENTPNAIKVLACWDSVFQEVLSERDWKFAKVRSQLELSQTQFQGSFNGTILTVTGLVPGNILQVNQPISGVGVSSGTIITALGTGTGGAGTYTVNNSQILAAQILSAPTIPIYGYRFAWTLPGDLLRFVRPHKRPHRQGGMWVWLWGPEGVGWYPRSDPPFLPEVAYVVESVQTGVDGDGNPTSTRCALTNYGGDWGPASINYIQLITDYTKLMPGFVNCLAWRIAQELSVAITEDKQKFEMMEQKYRDSLNSAEAQNETLDLVSFDEAGSTSWEDAGRWVRTW